MDQLPVSNLRSAEYCRNVWTAIVSSDTSIEQMLKPSFWGHVAQQFRVGDHVEVVSEDQSFYAEFYVRFARRLEASVSLLRKVDLREVRSTVDNDLTSSYSVKFRGSRAKFSVLQGDKIVRDNFETEELAQAWLNGHLKSLAA